jgi:hypothetical protein
MTPIFWQAPNNGPLVNLNHIVSIDLDRGQIRVLFVRSDASLILDEVASRSLLDAVSKYACNRPTGAP